MPRQASEIVEGSHRPEVIVDFSSQDGLLFITLKNIGERSAYGVTTRFNKPFTGLNGTKTISKLQLFRRLEFLPPRKEFTQFVDSVEAFFHRREPWKLTATIVYADREGRRFREAITHDLRIFRDLGHIRKLE